MRARVIPRQGATFPRRGESKLHAEDPRNAVQFSCRDGCKPGDVVRAVWNAAGRVLGIRLRLRIAGHRADKDHQRRSSASAWDREDHAIRTIVLRDSAGGVRVGAFQRYGGHRGPDSELDTCAHILDLPGGGGTDCGGAEHRAESAVAFGGNSAGDHVLLVRSADGYTRRGGAAGRSVFLGAGVARTCLRQRGLGFCGVADEHAARREVCRLWSPLRGWSSG